MPKPIKRDSELRALLEGISVELAVIRIAMPLTRLRVVQARERAGLTGLLSPALDELDDVSQSVSTIGQQVTSALAKLMER